MNVDALQNLGSRIVQAARLAVAMHLADELLSDDDPTNGRNIRIGGADDDGFTDEAPPIARDEHSSSFSADGAAG